MSKTFKPIVTGIYIHNNVNKILIDIDLLQEMNFIVNTFVNEAFYLYFLFIFFACRFRRSSLIYQVVLCRFFFFSFSFDSSKKTFCWHMHSVRFFCPDGYFY